MDRHLMTTDTQNRRSGVNWHFVSILQLNQNVYSSWTQNALLSCSKSNGVHVEQYVLNGRGIFRVYTPVCCQVANTLQDTERKCCAVVELYSEYVVDTLTPSAL
jgi:hypothetical protein